MSFTFEINQTGFDRARPFYQNLATRYLVGKTFKSFDEALLIQKYGDKRLSSYFRVIPSSFQPKTLPETILQAEIGIILQDESGVRFNNSPEAAFPILIAKAI